MVSLGGTALGHEEIGGVRNVLDEVDPPLPGVTIQVRISVADQLVVANPTGTELAVLGEQGEPFLRIGPDGALANVRSPTWFRSNDPTGAFPVSPRADADAAPEWLRVAREPAWGWFDHRLHRVQLGVLPPSDEPVELERWEVPMRYGDRNVVVRGRREYRPARGAFRTVVTDQVEGAEATVLAGTLPGIFLRVTGDETLTLLEEGDVPFARIGPEGAEVNETSATWSLTASARSGAAPAGDVGTRAAPRWKRIAPDPFLGWLEPRTRYQAEEPPRAVLEAGREQVVHRWSIPVRIGDERHMLAGTTSWVPAHPQAASGPVVAILVAAVALLTLVGVGVVLRRRRRRLS